MRHLALPALLALALVAPLAAEDGHQAEPGAAPAAHPDDQRAQMRDLEKKLRQIRDDTVKGDEELGKLQSDVKEAQKKFETAVEEKLKGNADYQEAKKQLDDLRPKKKDKEQKPPKKPEGHEQN